MNKEQCYELGRVTRVHGLKGELQIILDVDTPRDYTGLDALLVEEGGQLAPYFIQNINIQNTRVILKLEEIDSFEAAQPFVGTKLWLPLTNLPELVGDSFYFHEVIDFQVIDTNLGPLGTVKEVVSLGQQDLLVMDYQTKEVLIPLVDAIVHAPDRTAQTLSVTLPDGLLEIYLDEA